MPATFYQHPSAPVTLQDPRDPLVVPAFVPPTEEEWRRLDGCEAVNRLMDEHGAARVATWVRNLAAMRGEAI